jgi:hypothetical protein
MTNDQIRARALRLDVRKDHDDPAHSRWLRGAQ